MTIYHLLGIEGIRFLFFDYVPWQPARDKFLGSLGGSDSINKFLNCPFCQGFWLGLFFNFYNMYLNKIGILDTILFSFATGMFCYILCIFIKFAESVIVKNDV